MKSYSFAMSLISVVMCMACNSKSPSGSPEEDADGLLGCNSNEECLAECVGYAHATCSVDRVCVCADAVPVQVSQCQNDDECADACSDYDSHNCNGGICTCSRETIIELGCDAQSDCADACLGADSYDCSDGACICTTIHVEEGPYECPAITRGGFAGQLYKTMNLSGCPGGPDASCTDISDGTTLSCEWGALEAVGIFDIMDNCRPNNLLNRAEVVKIVITTIDGLADYEAPATPTFNDVPVTAWYYDYVEAAVQLGIVSGYVDASGNLTGEFGPGNTASTCWVAEVLQKAFPPVGPVVTVTYSGPTGRFIAQGATNVQILNYSITAERDLLVRNMDLTISLSVDGTAATRPNGLLLGSGTAMVHGGSTTQNVCVTGSVMEVSGIVVYDMISIPTAAGSVTAIVTAVNGGNVACPGSLTEFSTNYYGAFAVAAGTVQEVDPYTLIRNVKVVDRDSGSTLQGPMNKASDGTWVENTYTKKMTEDYELTGGETCYLSVQVDLDWNMAAGYKLAATINYLTDDGYIKDMVANQNILASEIIGGYLTGQAMTTVINSLLVGLAAAPTSQTVVKGSDKVSALGMDFTAGMAGDITIKKIAIRLYGNSSESPWANALGDAAANTIVASATLYSGVDIVDGPRTLNLVDVGSNGFTPGTDYYKVLFDNLDLKVAKGNIQTLTVKVALLNSIPSTVYLAVDLDPAVDVVAEDEGYNSILAAGSSLNGAAIHGPELTIATSGTLTAATYNCPAGGNVVEGTAMVLVAKYRFDAVGEGFSVNKLTVMNDWSASFNTPLDTIAVSQVIVKYPDVNGVTQTKIGTLSSGSSTLSSLDFYVPANLSAYIEIYADVSDENLIGPGLIGTSFRLGIQDTGNTVSTFEAVGASTSTSTNTLAITDPESVNAFTVIR